MSDTTPPAAAPAATRTSIPASLEAIRARLGKKRTVTIPIGGDDVDFEIRKLTAAEEGAVRMHMVHATPPIRTEKEKDPKTGEVTERPVIDAFQMDYRVTLDRLFDEGKALAVYIGIEALQIPELAWDGTPESATKVTRHVQSLMPSLAAIDQLFQAIMPNSAVDAGAHATFFPNGGSPAN